MLDYIDSEFKGRVLDGILGEEEAQVNMKRLRIRDRASGFRPGCLDWDILPQLPDPTIASSSALRTLSREAKELSKIQDRSDLAPLGWYIDFGRLTNLLHWIVELHTFDDELPLAQDMKKKGCNSIVLEYRFGGRYPLTTPFVRVIHSPFPHLRSGWWRARYSRRRHMLRAPDQLRLDSRRESREGLPISTSRAV